MGQGWRRGRRWGKVPILPNKVRLIVNLDFPRLHWSSTCRGTQRKGDIVPDTIGFTARQSMGDARLWAEGLKAALRVKGHRPGSNPSSAHVTEFNVLL